MRPVAVNGASFSQRITGVQRYARELSSRLLSDPACRLILPAPVHDWRPPEGASVQVLPLPGPLRRLGGAHAWVNSTLANALQDGEVLWSPTVRAPVRRCDHVFTVHDMSVIDHPEWFRPSVVAQWQTLVRLTCHRAAHLLAVSHFTKSRLVAAFEINPDRVTVVGCGVDPRFSEADSVSAGRAREAYALPERFALCVSSHDPRKNIAHLLASWPEVYRQSGLVLALVGGAGRTFARHDLAADLPGVKVLGYVRDDDLPSLYSAASVVAYPSVYEGFGLPPLEAMAAGTPVVALAKTAAVVEVMGDTGVLVSDPSPAAFGDAVMAIAFDDERRAALARVARARADTFTWDVAATNLRQVLADPERAAETTVN